MFRSTTMKLVELMVLRQDIDRVLEYLGKRANFQMHDSGDFIPANGIEPAREILEKLQSCRTYLGIEDIDEYAPTTSLPSDADLSAAQSLIDRIESMRAKELEAADRQKRVVSAWDEARAFANLKVPYGELEHLTFLSLRIGRVDPAVFEDLRFSLGDRAVIVSLGEDNTRILAASSKKGRFALDTELKRFGFIPLEIPQGFKGVPDDILSGLRLQSESAVVQVETLGAERKAFALQVTKELLSLIESFSLSSQVLGVRESLESTQLVYRVMGWIASDESTSLMRDLDGLTEGRVAIRTYSSNEVPSIKNGREKVPVQYRHNALVKSFERMVFSYGSPLYGTIDPTPMVAFFFTLLFGIMFGDVGQGMVFFILGLALRFSRAPMLKKVRHFGPIFLAIGCSSAIMGVLTGEFFANGEVLQPFSRWVTGFFGEPRDRILELMPSREAMARLILFFGFTVALGFIINSVGLIINIVNQFSLGHPGKAIFSKVGMCGALFFWYVVFACIRIALTHGTLRWFDVVCIAIPLIGIFLAEPFNRLIEGHRPVLENGLFAAVIEGVVEILEIVSTYISNSVSFLRVGAFALSHAVLSFIIFTMSEKMGGSLSAGGLLITILGNAVIIVLEGLIVTIQVVRLQYYEFFSKFFTETGKEFKPFRFKYKEK